MYSVKMTFTIQFIGNIMKNANLIHTKLIHVKISMFTVNEIAVSEKLFAEVLYILLQIEHHNTFLAGLDHIY